MLKWQRTIWICIILLFSSRILLAEDGLKLLIPPDLGDVNFGDPVYLPIVIVNDTDEEAIVASLFGSNPMMTVTARVNAPGSAAHETVGFQGSPFTTMPLPPRHQVRVILACKFWHPLDIERIPDMPEFLVEVQTFDNGSRWFKNPPLILSDESRFKVNGSSVKNLFDYIRWGREMVEACEKDGGTPIPVSIDMPHWLQAQYSVYQFMRFWTFAWRNRGELILNTGPYPFRYSQTPEYRAIRDQVLQGTALFRAMRCAEIYEYIEHGEESLEERVDKGLKDFRDVLSDARPAEYEFHVLSLRHVRVSNPESDEQARYRDTIREAFPDVLAGITDEGFLPVVPLRY